MTSLQVAILVACCLVAVDLTLSSPVTEEDLKQSAVVEGTNEPAEITPEVGGSTDDAEGNVEKENDEKEGTEADKPRRTLEDCAKLPKSSYSATRWPECCACCKEAGYKFWDWSYRGWGNTCTCSNDPKRKLIG